MTGGFGNDLPVVILAVEILTMFLSLLRGALDYTNRGFS